MEPIEETASNPQITESAGRDVKGRFTKGNMIGKGRPVLGRSVAQLIRDIGNEEITVKAAKIKLTRLEATLRRAWVDAMAGNKDARVFIFERGWGKPKQPISFEDENHEVIELLRQMAESLRLATDDELEAFVDDMRGQLAELNRQASRSQTDENEPT